MKKLLLLFTTLLLISCSSDDGDDVNNNENTNGDKTVLIKRITEYYDGGSTTDVYVADYVYDGNKIVSIKEYLNDNLRYTYNFTYTNNLISQYNSIDERNDQYSWSTFFRYDNNNRLTEYIYTGYNEYSENFVYNGNIVTSDDCTTFELQNNQIISFTEYNDDMCQIIGYTANLTYDNNKNAFANIEGYNWFFSYDYTLSATIEYPSGINNITFDGDFDYAYDYNENGYPRNVTVTEDGSLVATLTIEYY
ncbi:MAG: Uncharacterised protein [Bacteroidota bacterium]|nr:MAG: Uncharacterised protein [Bacteroidota bacterium]